VWCGVAGVVVGGVFGGVFGGVPPSLFCAAAVDFICAWKYSLLIITVVPVLLLLPTMLKAFSLTFSYR
jgi:hypothetical protein